MTTSIRPRSMTDAGSSSAPAAAAEPRQLHEPLPASQRAVVLVVILTPLAGLIIAIAYGWGWGVGWLEIGLLAGMYLLTGLGITVGYHRLFTHKSFETGKVVTIILAVLGAMAVEGPLLRWVAFHRCHHQHSDHADDPHSPHGHGSGVRGILRGFWFAHSGWMLRRSDRHMARYAKDLRKDPLLRTISRLFPLWIVLGLLIPALIGGLVTMSWSGAALGFLWGGLVRVLLVHHVTWSVNSVCHLWGTRPFRSHDESRNNAIVGALALGEGWHNNHHAFPTSARHGLRWWEFDLSWIVIWTLHKAHLAWDVRTPTPERMASRRNTK